MNNKQKKLTHNNKTKQTGGSSWGKKSEIAASSSSLFDSTNGNGQKSYDVNVAGSKRAVALAEEGRDKGIDILAELDSQVFFFFFES